MRDRRRSIYQKLPSPSVHRVCGESATRALPGRYTRFVLIGPCPDLPEATTRVAQIVSERKIPLRDAYHIEHYANDPNSKPEENLITEILSPVA